MIFRSAYPDIVIPDVSLHRLVLDRAAGLGDKPALIDGPSGRILTYAHFSEGVERVAVGLAARGFGKGDVLALFAPNVPEFASATGWKFLRILSSLFMSYMISCAGLSP